MKLEDAIELERKDFEKRITIREKKGHDYANDDILANFKATADVCKALEKNDMSIDITTAHGVALYYGLLKMLRRLNLYTKKVDPLNESLQDTFLDASNYIDLEKECYLDSLELRKTRDKMIEDITKTVSDALANVPEDKREEARKLVSAVLILFDRAKN